MVTGAQDLLTVLSRGMGRSLMGFQKLEPVINLLMFRSMAAVAEFQSMCADPKSSLMVIICLQLQNWAKVFSSL